MKRRGDTRSDGYRFWSYEKRGDRFREKWLNPESFERQKRNTACATGRWRRRVAVPL